MRHHRFFIQEKIIPGQSLVVFDREIVSQVRQVLRLKAGDEIIVCDHQGHEAVAVIEAFTKDSLTLQLFDAAKNVIDPATEVTLYCAIAKRENFEWVCQKATEVGVARIVPLITARTVKLNIKPERIEKIILEAAEQSGRGKIPALIPPLEFSAAVATAKENEKNIIFEKSGVSVGSVLPDPKITKVGIFIGPEGGWEAGELLQAKEHGLLSASLGNLTLRTETAAIIATYLAVQK